MVYGNGTSLFFQQFDQFGNKIGTEGLLTSTNVEAGQNFDIIAVENGGVVIAYETTTDFIQVQSFDIAGGVATQTTDISRTFLVPGLSINGLDPSLSGTTIADVAVHALVFNATTRNLVTFTDLDMATLQSSTVATAFNSDTEQETAILENGNRVVVLNSGGQGGTNVQDVTIHILDGDGASVTTLQFTSGADDEVFQPQITALVGGRFVIAWRSEDGDSDILFAVFEADGTLVTTGASFSNGNDENNDPELVALPDIGFLLFIDRDDAGNQIFAQRFNADGSATGGVTVLNAINGNMGEPVATLLNDGFVALTYLDGDGSPLQVQIIATEALDVVLTDADETVTATVDDDTIEGAGGADSLDGGDGFDTLSFASSDAGVTVDLISGTGTGGDAEGDTYINFENIIGSDFDDTLFGEGSDGTIFGGAGDDSLTGHDGTNELFGGDGDDELFGISGADAMDGGDGIDTANYHIVGNPGVTVNLETGIGSGGIAQGDTYTSIENIIGTGSADNLTGDSGSNVIHADNSVDTVEGGDGEDELFGGDGGDVIFGDDNSFFVSGNTDPEDIIENLVAEPGVAFDDSIYGGAGSDFAYGGFGDDGDNLFGDDGEDSINGGYGDDLIFGGTGADILFGGADVIDETITNSENDELYGGSGMT